MTKSVQIARVLSDEQSQILDACDHYKKKHGSAKNALVQMVMLSPMYMDYHENVKNKGVSDDPAA